jgi:Helix-turn-helix domain
MSSAEEIGRQLRAAREERGLDLLAVHDRLSRPITQLEALERGDLARLPDQALALSTLRRYAAFLGLDGDALALRMIDAWSAVPRPTSNGSTRIQSGAAAMTNVVAAVTTSPEHLRAFTQTGQVPKVGGGSAAAGGYGYGTATGPPTGTFPVVPRQEIKHSKRAVAKARRHLRAPTSLKVVTWVTAAMVVVALAGFGVRQWRSQWLVRSHIIRIVQPGGAQASTTPAAAPAVPSKTPARP